MKIVKEKSTNETSKYLKELESRMGFPIRMIQVDNGPEFVNDGERTELESASMYSHASVTKNAP